MLLLVHSFLLLCLLLKVFTVESPRAQSSLPCPIHRLCSGGSQKASCFQAHQCHWLPNLRPPSLTLAAGLEAVYPTSSAGRLVDSSNPVCSNPVSDLCPKFHSTLDLGQLWLLRPSSCSRQHRAGLQDSSFSPRPPHPVSESPFAVPFQYIHFFMLPWAISSAWTAQSTSGPSPSSMSFLKYHLLGSKWDPTLVPLYSLMAHISFLGALWFFIVLFIVLLVRSLA